jgi:hypothetical protein
MSLEFENNNSLLPEVVLEDSFDHSILQQDLLEKETQSNILDMSSFCPPNEEPTGKKRPFLKQDDLFEFEDKA